MSDSVEEVNPGPEPIQVDSDSEPDCLPFEDVQEDVAFVTGATGLYKTLKRLTDHVDSGSEILTDENLDAMSRVDRDLFLLYAINSLVWVRLKLEGQEPSGHPVKQHLDKVRELMQRKQAVVDKKKRPVLDKNVAGRFIRSGLWDPNANKTSDPPNKKIKFDD